MWPVCNSVCKSEWRPVRDYQIFHPSTLFNVELKTHVLLLFSCIDLQILTGLSINHKILELNEFKVTGFSCLSPASPRYGICSAAVTGLLRCLFPSQPHWGAVDVGALSPSLPGLGLHPPSLTGQTLVDLRGHREEGPLHVVGALGARLQEGDFKGQGKFLGRTMR